MSNIRVSESPPSCVECSSDQHVSSSEKEGIAVGTLLMDKGRFKIIKAPFISK